MIFSANNRLFRHLMNVGRRHASDLCIAMEAKSRLSKFPLLSKRMIPRLNIEISRISAESAVIGNPISNKQYMEDAIKLGCNMIILNSTYIRDTSFLLYSDFVPRSTLESISDLIAAGDISRQSVFLLQRLCEDSPIIPDKPRKHNVKYMGSTTFARNRPQHIQLETINPETLDAQLKAALETHEVDRFDAISFRIPIKPDYLDSIGSGMGEIDVESLNACLLWAEDQVKNNVCQTYAVELIAPHLLKLPALDHNTGIIPSKYDHSAFLSSAVTALSAAVKQTRATHINMCLVDADISQMNHLVPIIQRLKVELNVCVVGVGSLDASLDLERTFHLTDVTQAEPLFDVQKALQRVHSLCEHCGFVETQYIERKLHTAADAVLAEYNKELLQEGISPDKRREFTWFRRFLSAIPQVQSPEELEYWCLEIIEPEYDFFRYAMLGTGSMTSHTSLNRNISAGLRDFLSVYKISVRTAIKGLHDVLSQRKGLILTDINKGMDDAWNHSLKVNRMDQVGLQLQGQTVSERLVQIGLAAGLDCISLGAVPLPMHFSDVNPVPEISKQELDEGESLVKKKKKPTVFIGRLTNSMVKTFGENFKLPFHRVGLLDCENKQNN